MYWQLPSLVLLIGTFTVTFVARRRSAAGRHLLWAACFVALVILPGMHLWLPKWQVWPAVDRSTAKETDIRGAVPLEPMPATPVDGERPQVMLAPTEMVADSSVVVPSSPVDVSMLVLLIWGSVSAALLGRMAWHQVMLWRLRLRSDLLPIAEIDGLREDLGIRSPVQVVSHAKVTMPMTWGLWCPVVCLPGTFNAWSPTKRRAVLLHELGHVRRKDAWIDAIASLAVVLHWMNPLVWVARRRLVVERERACDDFVLGEGVKPSDYVETLLDVLESHGDRSLPVAGAAMAGGNGLVDRMERVLRPGMNRRATSISQRVGVMVLTAVITLPLVVVRAQETETEMETPTSSPNTASTAVVEELERIVAIQEQLVKVSEEGQQAGREEITDVLEARIELASVRGQLAEAKGDFASAEDHLKARVALLEKQSALMEQQHAAGTRSMRDVLESHKAVADARLARLRMAERPRPGIAALEERIIGLRIQWTAIWGSGLGHQHPMVKEVKASLELAEKQLAEAREQGGVSPMEMRILESEMKLTQYRASGLGNNHPLVRKEEATIRHLRTPLHETEEMKLIEAFANRPDANLSERARELYQRYLEAKEEHHQLSLRYKERHPWMVANVHMLEKLIEQLMEEVKGVDRSQKDDGSLLNFLKPSAESSEPATCRVWLRRAHYFKDDIPNIKELYCVGLSSPGSEDPLAFAFVPKKSALGQKLDGELQWLVSYSGDIELVWKDVENNRFVEIAGLGELHMVLDESLASQSGD